MSAALGLMAAVFVALAPLGGPLTRALLRRGIGKNIRYDGPTSHQVKAGTATMGGLLFVPPVVLGGAVLAIVVDARLWLAVAAVLLYAALGAYDDLQGLRDRLGVGWLARGKFAWQWVIAALLGLALYLTPGGRVLALPLSRLTVDLGWWIVPVAALLLVAFSNGINLSDGLDGLAGGLCAEAVAAYGLLALLTGQAGLGLFCALLVGSLLAFLWHNAHPATLFMGDVGSQALGAGLAMVALLSGQWLLLPVIGAVFVAELLSDVLQVGYFKYTKRRYGQGRRIFKMAPLHHHFEQLGWPETKVTTRFWVAGLVAAALGLILRAVGQ
ncbi:MAG: phospho-N-acetylmuramoyl-pentapeptide-transferase [Anaerolineales bacterium]